MDMGISQDIEMEKGEEKLAANDKIPATAITNDESQTLDSASLSSSQSAQETPPIPGTSKDETKEAVTVPRSQRRGLLARVAILPEIEDSKTFSRSVKWGLTFIVAAAGTAGPMGSAIILPVLTDIEKAFSTTAFIANLSVAVYMFAMAIFPLWWSSFSETLGRRTIYLSAFLMYVVFSILSAESVNMSMFIVSRMLAGGASASVQAVGAGTIADIWEVKERGRAMGIFYLGPLCGPLLGPIVGGALGEGLGWRSVLWFLVIYAGCVWILILFCLPETLRMRRNVVAEAQREVEKAAKDSDDTNSPLTRTATRQSVKLKTREYAAIFRRCTIDPLAMLLELRSLPVALTVYFSAISFGCLYTLNIAIQKTFSAQPYGYSTVIVGLLYIPGSLGYLLGSIFGGRWVDYIMHREARKANRVDAHGKLIFRPEDRMRENVWIGAVLYPCALIWYGWTAAEGVLWIAPAIANFFFGIGTMLVVGPVITMLTEFMPDRPSHGMALNNCGRNILAGVGVLVANPAINGIGDGWLFTILGIWTLVGGPPVILTIKWYGQRARKDQPHSV